MNRRVTGRNAGVASRGASGAAARGASGSKPGMASALAVAVAAVVLAVLFILAVIVSPGAAQGQEPPGPAVQAALLPDPAAQAAPPDPAAQAAQVRESFWDVLSDPVLDELLAQAIESNPDLRAVEARIEGADADQFVSTLDLLPVVTANGGYTRQRISSATFPGLSGTLPDQGYWEAGVRMSWEVDVFGRGRRTRDGRSALAGASRDDARDARVLLTGEVAGAYFRLRGAQDRLAVARRNAENQQRTLALTEERLEAGRGTALDTERARAQLSTTLSAIPAIEAAVTAEQNRIAVLLGRQPGSMEEELSEEAALPQLPAQIEIPDAAVIVGERPDVQGAQERLAASQAFVSSAKTGYLPRLSVQGAAGYTASEFNNLGSSGTPRYVVGPVISWPLLDLGRVKADVDGARADREEARARYQSAVLGAEEELQTSIVTYTRTRERLENLEDAAAASSRATDLARLRFQEGAGDFLEVLDAERRLLEAEDRLSSGRTEATTALVAVYRALGGAGRGEPVR